MVAAQVSVLRNVRLAQHARHQKTEHANTSLLTKQSLLTSGPEAVDDTND